MRGKTIGCLTFFDLNLWTASEIQEPFARNRRVEYRRMRNSTGCGDCGYRSQPAHRKWPGRDADTQPCGRRRRAIPVRAPHRGATWRAPQGALEYPGAVAR